MGPRRYKGDANTYQSFGNRFKNYDAFKQFYYNAIKDHKFIMYNTEEGKYNIYRAPENIPSFLIKYNKKLNYLSNIYTYVTVKR
jgi:hypothetical protein